MAIQGWGQDNRQRYARLLGCSARSTVNAPSNRYLLWDGTVRWVREGASLPYEDIVLLIGRNSRFAVRYSVDALGALSTKAHARFPSLGNAYFVFDRSPSVRCDGKTVQEIVRFVDQKGDLRIQTVCAQCSVEHLFYPATQAGGLVERITVCNTGLHAHTFAVSVPHYGDIRPIKGGRIYFWVEMGDDTGKMLSRLDVTDMHSLVESGESAVFYVVYYALAEDADLLVDCRLEYKKWQESVGECFESTLRLQTPVPLVDAAFAHAAFFGVQNVMDSPVGMVITDVGEGAMADTWAASIPYFALSGCYRGSTAVKNELRAMAAQWRKGVLPAALLADGTPIGEGDETLFALGCALWALCTAEQDVDLYQTVREILCKPLPGKATLAQCATAYAAYRYAGVWAMSLSQAQDGAMWQQKSKEAAEVIERRFGDDKTGAYLDKTSLASVALPLVADLGFRGEACAKLLATQLYDGGAALYEGKNKRRASDANLLLAVAGLQTVGYHDLAFRILYEYTRQCLLGEGAPCPTDRRDKGGLPASKESLLYCAVATAGLFGLRPMGNALYVCLHFPTDWRFAVLSNVHYAGRVLTLSWQDDVLVVRDLYDNELYRDKVYVGQPVVINL